jgi:hypothetical protein
MTYGERWSRFWLVVDALGVGLSLLVWRPLTAVVALVALTAFSATMIALLGPTGAQPPRPVPRAWRRLATLALATGSGTLAWVAGAVVCWPVALLLLVAAVVSSPWLVRRLQAQRPRGVGGDPSASALLADGPPRPPHHRVDQLTTPDLCEAWKRSFVSLMNARTPQQRLLVVVARQNYLDEMARRCPAGFAAWLESGARPAGAPDRYLVDDGGAWGDEDAAA